MSDKQKPRKQQFRHDKEQQSKSMQSTKTSQQIRSKIRVEHKRAGMKGR